MVQGPGPRGARSAGGGVKLFVVARKGLRPGHQAVQGMHALCVLQERYSYPSSATLAFLEATSSEMRALCDRLLLHDVPHAVWGEPYHGTQHTALAVGPAGAEIVEHLPLALARDR